MSASDLTGPARHVLRRAVSVFSTDDAASVSALSPADSQLGVCSRQSAGQGRARKADGLQSCACARRRTGRVAVRDRYVASSGICGGEKPGSQAVAGDRAPGSSQADWRFLGGDHRPDAGSSGHFRGAAGRMAPLGKARGADTRRVTDARDHSRPHSFLPKADPASAPGAGRTGLRLSLHAGLLELLPASLRSARVMAWRLAGVEEDRPVSPVGRIRFRPGAAKEVKRQTSLHALSLLIHG